MKKNSLNQKIWKYFLIFSLFILSFLWFFQVIFFNKYYEITKIQDTKTVAKKIKNNQSSNYLASIINKNSLEKEVCVEIVDSGGITLYRSAFRGKGCLQGQSYKALFITSGKSEGTYEIINQEYDTNSLVSALKLDNGTFAFVNTSLDPIESTVVILKNQLLVITIITILLAFTISYFISIHISKPIENISNEAKHLAKGNFNIDFAENDILEINELAKTLNYTKNELIKTDELRRDLMANVSHDLKTPLTMIKAYAEMSTDLHSHNKEKQKEDMEIIINETNRLTTLVNDILILSKMQSDIEELNIESFDLVEQTNNILKSYSYLKELENYNFIFKHNKKKIILKADKKKIEQAIYNLINNAINYTGDDNKIYITITDKNNIIRVEIKDTGKGIKKEDLPYIWDKYYKNKKKHKRNLIGTGLGLSIVKNILEKHNFNYGVTTKENKGTSFYFETEKQAD